jgi:hypothetical protein
MKRLTVLLTVAGAATVSLSVSERIVRFSAHNLHQSVT